jgi:predicted ATP-dependent endonuclease of OLD family
MKIKHIKIQGFRGIDELTLDFGAGNMSVLIGVNGVGESSAASRHNFRVDRSEFTACVIDFHLPIDPALGLVNIG